MGQLFLSPLMSFVKPKQASLAKAYSCLTAKQVPLPALPAPSRGLAWAATVLLKVQEVWEVRVKNGYNILLIIDNQPQYLATPATFRCVKFGSLKESLYFCRQKE